MRATFSTLGVMGKNISLVAAIWAVSLALAGCSNSGVPEVATTGMVDEWHAAMPSDYSTEISGLSYGKTERIEYRSVITGAQKHAVVSLPADYDGVTKYPVLYLLHGAGADDETWMQMGAQYIVQNLHNLEDNPEMIIVAVNSLVNQTESEIPSSGDELLSVQAVADFDKTGEEIIISLMPYINNEYATLTDREDTAIIGFSMGGREALYTAFTYPTYFSAVGALTPAPLLEPIGQGLPPLLDTLRITDDKEPFSFVMVNAGEIDFVVGDSPQNIDKELTVSGIEHRFYVTEGGHEPQVWQDGLYNFARNIFRSDEP